MRLALAFALAAAASTFSSPVAAASIVSSPAEQRIAEARKALSRDADDGRTRVDLAMALARRARETSDVSFYAQAQVELDIVLAKSPDDFEALKARCWVLLGQHEFAKALELARALSKRMPDDVMVYGLMTDAAVEMGKYAEAEAACQWMLDIRPGNLAGVTRAAYLRELFGDVPGAVALMSTAFQQVPPTETEERAWILTHVAHLMLSTGKVAEAETLASQALAEFPRYHYALAQLAKVRMAQGRHEEAVALYRERYEGAPHPENLLDVAHALAGAGRSEEAAAARAKFEVKARAEMRNADNCNRDLALHLVDVGKPSEALEVAALELEHRQDVFTLDAHAWALHANGSDALAWTQVEKALAVGIQDARILYHAGAIAAALHDAESARRWLLRSLEVNPTSDDAAHARAALAALDAPRAHGPTRG